MSAKLGGKIMKLVELKEIKGRIILETGLHIGAGDIEMHIGGTDNPVVKHPFTHEPYIPGSSLKGKVRSLLELKSGLLVYSEGNPLSMKAIEKAKKQASSGDIELARKILKLFGTSGAEAEEAKELGPTRVSFSDCMITKDYREKAQKGEIVLTEIKAENMVNRITGTAENPRFTERVPAGVEFDFSVTLKVFEGDEDDLEEILLKGLKLLEQDALGGSGSRGYGRIRFEFDDEGIRRRYEELTPIE